jgi:hypothetical protein
MQHESGCFCVQAGRQECSVFQENTADWPAQHFAYVVAEADLGCVLLSIDTENLFAGIHRFNKFPNGERVTGGTACKHLSFYKVNFREATFGSVETRPIGITSSFHLFLQGATVCLRTPRWVKPAEGLVNSFGNKIDEFVVYPGDGTVRKKENNCWTKTNRLPSTRRRCLISTRHTTWRDGLPVTITMLRMWSRKHSFGLSSIGKVFLDTTAGLGCLRLCGTLFIRGSANRRLNRN